MASSYALLGKVVIEHSCSRLLDLGIAALFFFHGLLQGLMVACLPVCLMIRWSITSHPRHPGSPRRTPDLATNG